MKLPIYREFMRGFTRGNRRALKLLQLQPACREGCAFCCTHGTPNVAPLEAQAIAELIRSRDDLADVPAKMLEQARESARLRIADPDALWAAGALGPCPLLGPDRRCRIYQDRPLDCAMAMSMDRAKCEAFAAADPAGSTRKTRPWSGDGIIDEYVGALARTLKPWQLQSLRERSRYPDQPLYIVLSAMFFPEEHERLCDAVKARLRQLGRPA